MIYIYTEIKFFLVNYLIRKINKIILSIIVIRYKNFIIATSIQSLIVSSTLKYFLHLIVVIIIAIKTNKC